MKPQFLHAKIHISILQRLLNSVKNEKWVMLVESKPVHHLALGHAFLFLEDWSTFSP
jgi:hypothetical protein